MSANGVQYSKEFEGILPELMSTFYAERQSIQAELKPMKKIDNPSSDILDKIRMMDVAQNGIKIGILNSGYGALGNKHFKYFDTKLAEAVTLGSQIAIRWVGTAINEYLNKVCKTIDEEYYIYSDTDSVDFSTLVYVNDEKIAIGELYNRYDVYSKKDDVNKNYVKPLNGETTLSVNMVTGELEEKEIKYVMKHKVKKCMYKISVNGSSVVCTEDHSIIVKRNGSLLSISPKDIIFGDEVVIINNPT
jgi:DNA polymerase elongation subunit (family B)